MDQAQHIVLIVMESATEGMEGEKVTSRTRLMAAYSKEGSKDCAILYWMEEE